jgi:hypothetical protein
MLGSDFLVNRLGFSFLVSKYSRMKISKTDPKDGGSVSINVEFD